MKKRIAIIGIVVVALLCSIILVGKYLKNYEDETETFERAFDSLSKLDFIDNVDNTVIYSGDGNYKIEFTLQYNTQRYGEIHDYLTELGKYDVNFKELTLSFYDGKDKNGNKKYDEDYKIKYNEFNKTFK